ncbi:hypothetical protein GOP47_0007974 [Adiantum capillus-veneris]|uniref:Helicase ATP-binding domain-containing protein n=1 Tax=Adiantum capillus-veneris TaxID=13818 RepID=A0A9D4V1P9_ADICA|nr:hypothetical protein GOP47_0007974 [Adiantum capillus-veneris]
MALPVLDPHCSLASTALQEACIFLPCSTDTRHPLLCSKRHLVGWPTHNCHTQAGIPLPSFFARRDLAVARAVVEEIAIEEEQEGVDEIDIFSIPTDLPWTVSSSLAVHSWGTIHNGPLEAKYFNPSKKFPYPVGFMSIKLYKGKEYCQFIEEGLQGPVFVVKEAVLGEFKAESPQRVWSSTCKNGAVHVHGMRHFGFDSPEVIRVLQAMHFQSKKFSNKGSEKPLFHSMDVAAPADVSSLRSSAKGDAKHLEFFFTETQTEKLNNDTDGIVASPDDVDDAFVHYEADKDDDENEFLDSINNDGQHVEDEVSVNAYADNKVDEFPDNGTHISKKLETESNEMVHLITENFANERVERPMQRRKLTYSKRSFKAGSRKYTFSKGILGSQDVIEQDLIKHDSVQENEKVKSLVTASQLLSIPSTGRQKTSPSETKQIWRKGEGLSGYIPGQNKQQATENIRLVEQMEGFYGVVPSYGKQQQAAEKMRSGEQVSGYDKTKWKRVVDKSYDCRASELLSNDNVLKASDNSILGAKEENFNSSKSLLGLLDKWNRSKELDRESQNLLEKGSLQVHIFQGEDVDLFKQMNVENKRAFSVPDSGSASQEDLPSENDDNAFLNDLCSNKFIDESTNVAISTLFETEGELHLLSNDGSQLSRKSKSMLDGVETMNQDRKSWKSASTSVNTAILDGGINSAVDANLCGLKNSAQVGITMSNFSRELGREENIFGSLEDEIGRTKQAANGVRLIEDPKTFFSDKIFGNVLEKVKAMKLSEMAIMEDVYEEAILGFHLDSWQRQVLKELQDGNSLLISAPSGAGKSAVADYCILHNVVNEKRVLFVTPYEHLVTWNLHKFKCLLGEPNVGAMWTSTNMQENPSLVVITLKVLSSILHELNGPGESEFRFFFDGIDMVVLDKFCTFNEAKYGRLWEEVLMLLDTNISVVALTLPATNETQIAAWMSMSRGPCKLISCKSETVLKRYFFCCKDGLYPLLKPEGLQPNKNPYKARKVHGNSLSKDQLQSTPLSVFDRWSLKNTVNMLEAKGLLPAIVMFFDVKSCDDAMHDVLNEMDDLLSVKEIEYVEAFLDNFESKHPRLRNQVERADRGGLLKGFAVYHEGKLTLWQDIVMELFQKNLIKLLFVTDSSLLQTDFAARTVVISEILKVTQNGVFFIPQGQFLQLIGRAGRRGVDIEGSIIFLESIHCGPKDAASLLNNTFSYSSSFKPSYSLVANLMAKHNLSTVKTIVSRSFSIFHFFTEDTKARMLQELDQEFFGCLEQNLKLFEGLMKVNRRKLSNAPIFTRVDMRMAKYSMSQSGKGLPGILLAVIPGSTELFYMVFGADNCFHLLPVRAVDHVYVNEVFPLDVVVKRETGQDLQPPLVPPKENWSVDEVNSFGYIASGNSQTEEYVKLMMEYHQVQPIIAKEALRIRKEIFVLEAQLSNLIEKRRMLQTGIFRLAEAATWQVHESEIWKEVMRILQVLEKVGAVCIIDSAEAYAKLNPLGMLISRLHDVENELWLAVALTSKHVKTLSSAEFAGFLATLIPRDPERESLSTPGKELAYRVTRSLKEEFSGLEVLRREVAMLQGSYSPSLQFDVGFAGLVCAWAQEEADTNNHYVIRSNDGDLAWRFRTIARLANTVHKACSQVLVGTPDRNQYRNLSSLAKEAEHRLLKHLIALKIEHSFT